MTDNFIIIGILLAVLALTMYFLFKKDYSHEDDEEDIYSIDYLWNGVKDRINELTDTSHVDYSLTKEAARKEEARKLELIKALRTCGYGDINAKNFVKDHIKRILQRDFSISEATINKVIPFDKEELLTPQDKFDILLYIYEKQFELDAFYHMVKDNGLDAPNGIGSRDDEFHYDITKEDIEGIYSRTDTTLDYVDKLSIVTQRVYARYQGNGAIDELRDMGKLDGVSAGLSGRQVSYYNYLEEYMVENRNDLEYYYDSIWCMFQGKTIRLSVLSFGTEAEMIRVVKKIYRYDDPGYLSEDKGYIISSMSDGSRIVVVRPKVGENWAFFIRKLNSIEDISIEKLITDSGSEKAIKVIGWLVSGCLNIAVTGKQFSGKTTLTKSLIEFINPVYNLGIQEMIFELHVKNIRRYRFRDVITLRDTPTVSAQEILDLFKKMDRDVYIFGEVHSPYACSLVIQGGMSGTRQIIFTHHAKTTRYLIDSFKVALQIAGLFPSEIKTAEEQVVSVLNFDIHMNTTPDGHIYLQRITEILPDEGPKIEGNLRECMVAFFKRSTEEHCYRTNDILIFKDGEYKVVGRPSDSTREKLSEYLSPEQLAEYDEFFKEVEAVA